MAGVLDSSWIPPAGTHDVAIGASLSRALKARKGETVRPKFERELYSFRYNFRPESVDTNTNGTLTVKKGDDKDLSVSVERASQVDTGGHSFVGKAPAAKEFDCVLIYDPVTMTFTMEKLDSCVQLNYDRKTSQSMKAASPLPVAAAPSRPSAPSSLQAAQNRSRQSQRTSDNDIIAPEQPTHQDADGELKADVTNSAPTPTQSLATKKAAEHDIRGAINTAGGARSNTASGKNSKLSAVSTTAASMRMEEEEGSEVEVALAHTLPAASAKPKAMKSAQLKKPAGTAKNAKSSAFRPFPKPRPSQLPPAAAMANPTKAEPTPSTSSQPPTGSKREREPDERPSGEAPPSAPTLPSRPKRPKIPLPTASIKPEKEKEAFSLALPTGTGISLPGVVASSAGGASTASVAAPSQVHVSAPPADESEEEEWDEVKLSVNNGTATQATIPLRPIKMEEIIPTSSRPPEPSMEGSAAGDDFLHDAFMDGDEREEEIVEEEEPGEDELDFLTATLVDNEEPHPETRPMSLNELAASSGTGDNLWGDEDDDTDDSSSSSDSDDD